MTSKYLIYGLVDPRNGQLRYVGKSTQGPKRARSHSYPGSLRRDRTRTGNWIRSLSAQGVKPEVLVLEEYQTPEVLPEAEVWNIAYWRSVGAELYNHTLGGEGCPGRKKTPEERQKLRLANLGNKNSLGHRHSEETRKLQSERARARPPLAPEVRAQISATLTGRKNGPPSSETRAKISAALMGHLKFPGSGRKMNSGRPIVDASGSFYSCVADACRILGVDSGSMARHLQGTRKSVGGMTFRYAEGT